MNKVTAYLLIAAMMISAFPLNANTLEMNLSNDTASISRQSLVNEEALVGFTRSNDLIINNITIEGSEVDGVYGNDFHYLFLEFTTIKTINNINVTMNVTRGVESELNTSNLGNCSAGHHYSTMEFNFYKPGWYTINATAEGWLNGGLINDTMEITVNFTNIFQLHLTELIQPSQVIPAQLFEVTVQVNNTGNAWNESDVRLVIVEQDHPENEVFNYTENSGNVSHGWESVNLCFWGIQIHNAGEYTIMAYLLGTNEKILSNLTVKPIPNNAPVLENISRMLFPGPLVPVGTKITFYINYSDEDGDKGNVTLYIDEGIYEMEIFEPPYMQDWIEGVQFLYTWLSIAGEHTYHFYADDRHGGNFTLDNETNKYNLNIIQPTYNVTVGPFTSSDKIPLPDVNVSFTLNGVFYWAITDSEGNATFKLPVKTIPNSTEITFKREGPYHADPPGPPRFLPSSSPDIENDRSDILIIITIVAAVFIIIIFVVLKRNLLKKKPS